MPVKPLLTRRCFQRTWILGAAALAAPVVHAQGSGSRKRLVLAVGNKASLHQLPLVLAEQLGYFRQEGLQLDILELQDDTRARAALLDGRADVGALPFDETILQQERQISRPQWLQSIVLLSRTPQVALGLALRHPGNLSHVNDLRGKRIGLILPDVSPHRIASMALERAGIRHDEVQWVDIGSAGEALMAVRRDQIDAISVTEPFMTHLEHRGEVRVIADTRTLSGTRDVFGGPVPSGCLCVTHAFARTQAQTCQALANGIVHALKWLQTAGPSDILKVVPDSFVQGDRALYLSAFNKVRETYSPDGVVSPEGPTHLYQALTRVETRTPTNRIVLSQTFTNQFAQRAKARFKA
jgi:NitT/TauT family transport system substrate-binding protein